MTQNYVTSFTKTKTVIEESSWFYNWNWSFWRI